MKTKNKLLAGLAMGLMIVLSSCEKDDDTTPDMSGATWSEVGTGSNALNANDDINTVSTDRSGNIYAAGAFVNASGKFYVARYGM